MCKNVQIAPQSTLPAATSGVPQQRRSMGDGERAFADHRGDLREQNIQLNGLPHESAHETWPGGTAPRLIEWYQYVFTGESVPLEDGRHVGTATALQATTCCTISLGCDSEWFARHSRSKQYGAGLIAYCQAPARKQTHHGTSLVQSAPNHCSSTAVARFAQVLKSRETE